MLDVGWLCCGLAACQPQLIHSTDRESASASGGDGSTDVGETGVLDVSESGEGEESTSGDGDEELTECNIYDQDCDPPQKCAELTAGENVCVDVPPEPAQLGERCEHDGGALGTDTCDIGLRCVRLAADSKMTPGMCMRYCVLTPPSATLVCEAAAGECVGEPAAVCVGRCDPLDPVACSPEETCGLVRDFWEGYACNRRSSSAAPEGPCSTDLDCVAGEVCTPSIQTCGAEQCCSPLCDLSSSDPLLDCPFGATDCIDRSWLGSVSNAGVCSF